mmetsp:Transcript_147076/g.256813  ORF Transcript_147076/g.256813 Transcript_147076/m.256813 type:complete len:299 (+) Transcript_147076:7954-8850(+)
MEDVGGDRVAERVAEPIEWELEVNDADRDREPPLRVNVWVGNGVGVSVGDGRVRVVYEDDSDSVEVGVQDGLRMGEADWVPDSENDRGDADSDAVADQDCDAENVTVSMYVALAVGVSLALGGEAVGVAEAGDWLLDPEWLLDELRVPVDEDVTVCWYVQLNVECVARVGVSDWVRDVCERDAETDKLRGVADWGDSVWEVGESVGVGDFTLGLREPVADAEREPKEQEADERLFVTADGVAVLLGLQVPVSDCVRPEGLAVVHVGLGVGEPAVALRVWLPRVQVLAVTEELKVQLWL